MLGFPMHQARNTAQSCIVGMQTLTRKLGCSLPAITSHDCLLDYLYGTMHARGAAQHLEAEPDQHFPALLLAMLTRRS